MSLYYVKRVRIPRGPERLRGLYAGARSSYFHSATPTIPVTQLPAQIPGGNADPLVARPSSAASGGSVPLPCSFPERNTEGSAVTLAPSTPPIELPRPGGTVECSAPPPPQSAGRNPSIAHASSLVGGGSVSLPFPQPVSQSKIENLKPKSNQRSLPSSSLPSLPSVRSSLPVFISQSSLPCSSFPRLPSVQPELHLHPYSSIRGCSSDGNTKKTHPQNTPAVPVSIDQNTVTQINPNPPKPVRNLSSKINSLPSSSFSPFPQLAPVNVPLFHSCKLAFICRHFSPDRTDSTSPKKVYSRCMVGALYPCAANSTFGLSSMNPTNPSSCDTYASIHASVSATNSAKNPGCTNSAPPPSNRHQDRTAHLSPLLRPLSGGNADLLVARPSSAAGEGSLPLPCPFPEGNTDSSTLTLVPGTRPTEMPRPNGTLKAGSSSNDPSPSWRERTKVRVVCCLARPEKTQPQNTPHMPVVIAENTLTQTIPNTPKPIEHLNQKSNQSSLPYSSLPSLPSVQASPHSHPFASVRGCSSDGNTQKPQSKNTSAMPVSIDQNTVTQMNSNTPKPIGNPNSKMSSLPYSSFSRFALLPPVNVPLLDSSHLALIGSFSPDPTDSTPCRNSRAELSNSEQLASPFSQLPPVNIPLLHSRQLASLPVFLQTAPAKAVSKKCIFGAVPKSGKPTRKHRKDTVQNTQESPVFIDQNTLHSQNTEPVLRHFFTYRTKPHHPHPLRTENSLVEISNSQEPPSSFALLPPVNVSLFHSRHFAFIRGLSPGRTNSTPCSNSRVEISNSEQLPSPFSQLPLLPPVNVQLLQRHLPVIPGCIFPDGTTESSPKKVHIWCIVGAAISFPVFGSRSLDPHTTTTHDKIFKHCDLQLSISSSNGQFEPSKSTLKPPGTKWHHPYPIGTGPNDPSEKQTTSLLQRKRQQNEIVSSNSQLLSLCLPHQSHHHALNDQLIRRNQFREFRIFGAQARLAPFHNISFQRAFIVHERGHHVPRAGGAPMFQDDIISSHDVFADHRIAADFQGKGAGGRADTKGIDIDTDAAFCLLFAILRETSGDGPVERHVQGHAAKFVPGGKNLQRARFVGRRLERPFSLQGTHVVRRRGQGDTHVLGDLAQAGSLPFHLLALPNVIQHLLLF
jgi:hypothetical protein